MLCIFQLMPRLLLVTFSNSVPVYMCPIFDKLAASSSRKVLLFSILKKTQEPEGHGAPKTPGRWKTLWASDCARLEEAHQRGDAEVLVYGRKYVVDMKVRLVPGNLRQQYRR